MVSQSHSAMSMACQVLFQSPSWGSFALGLHIFAQDSGSAQYQLQSPTPPFGWGKANPGPPLGRSPSTVTFTENASGLGSSPAGSPRGEPPLTVFRQTFGRSPVTVSGTDTV